MIISTLLITWTESKINYSDLGVMFFNKCREKFKCGSTFSPKGLVCLGLRALSLHGKPKSKKVFTALLFPSFSVHFTIGIICVLFTFETGISFELSFGTQRTSFWMTRASLEKTWVTSMLKGTCPNPNFNPSFVLLAGSVHSKGWF